MQSLRTKPVISAKNLNHYFGQGDLRKQALFNINSAQEGSLKILGQELCGASKQQLTQLCCNIGYIFQAHNLLTFLTAKQNVRMSLELHEQYLDRDMDGMSAEILKTVDLEHRVDYYADSLSGGQKQRVAIARALISRPKIVLADEPTAALDKKSGRDVVEIMQKLAKEQTCTILLVTHDNRILDIAVDAKRLVARHRIVYMEDSRLATQPKSDLAIALTIYTARVIITNSSPLPILTNASTCSKPNFFHTRCARLLNAAIVTRNFCAP